MARMMRIGALFAICLLAAGAILLMGNQVPGLRHERVPMVQDWTHRHMVYSKPGTTIRNSQLQQQPRYAQQVLGRRFTPPFPIGRPPIPVPIGFRPKKFVSDLHRDWQVLMPGGNYSVGDGVFPAKYQFDADAAPDCTHDFIVFTTSQGGGSSTDIYGLNNLYPGTCPTGTIPVPNLLWAYHVQSHTNGAAITSPILSLDGTQVAWVEGKGGTATLHILKPYTGGAGTLASPVTLTPSASAAAFRACAANSSNQGCLYNIDLANAKDDTGGGIITPSSPYYDYAYDVLFVGDDAGALHLFMGVFDGAPAEVTGGSTGWPFTVDAGYALTGPIYDDGSHHVFVGDSSGQLSYVNVTPGTFNASAGASWTIAGATSITDPPIVDGNTEMVFVFARTSSGAVVGEADTSLDSGSQKMASVGASNVSLFHSGAFDNTYYTSDNSTATGNLYVCGNNGGTNQPDLYQIAVTNGTIGATATPEFVAATSSQECSPVTEFYNATDSTDSIFFSVPASGNAATSCAGDGCLFGANVTGGTFQLTGSIPASGGTSGVVVDNDSSIPGGTNVYYSWLGNSTTPVGLYGCNGDTSGNGCTVQVAQLGLGSAGLVVQSNYGDGGGGVTSSTINLGKAATPGDLLLVFTHWDGAGITETVSDNNVGDTYAALGAPVNIGANNWIQAWYAKDCNNPSSITATFSGKTTSISVVDVIEYSGLDQSAPLDTSTYATNVGIGNPLTTGVSGMSTADDETIVGMFGAVGSGDFPFSPGSGFTQEVTDPTTYMEDLVVATTGTFTATATTGGTSDYGGIIVGFKNALQSGSSTTLVSIAVTPANASLFPGMTQQFTATGTYSDNSTKNITSSVAWSSTDTGVATITSTGLATGVAAGSTTIQATSNSISGSTDLTITNTISGEVGWWPFNEGSGTTAADYSGNGHTATLVNGVTWTTGKVGGAVSANGTNQYLSIPAIDLSGTDAVTLTAWVNRTYSLESGHILFEDSTNYNSSTTGFGFFPDESDCDGIETGVRGDAGYTVNCYTQPSSGVWHHLAMIFEKGPAGNHVVLYVDGVLQTPTQNYLFSNNTNNFGDNPIYVFSRGGTQAFTAATVSDLRLFNRALSVSEIQSLYNLGSGPLTLSLSLTTVTGGNPSVGTVTLNPAAPAGGTTVTLSSSNTAVATVPASVTVPAGATTANFTVNTLPVSVATPVTISASISGTTSTVTLNVVPPMSQLATDAFNRGNAATLGPNWTPLIGGAGNDAALQVAGDEAESSALSPSVAKELYFGGLNWGPDQYSEAQIVAAGGNGYDGPAVRMTSNDTYYACVVYSVGAGNASVGILSDLGGTSNTLAASTSVTVSAGDTVRCTAQGTSLSMTDETTSTTLLTASDASIPSGYPGLIDSAGTASVTNYVMANWAGGDSSPSLTLQQVASDNFNRADALNLGANWHVGPGHGPIQIVSDQIEPYPAGGQQPSKEHYVAAGAFPNDQWGRLQAVVQDTVGDLACELRASDTEDTMYVADLNVTGGPGTAETRLVKVLQGNIIPLVIDQQWSSVSPGDYIRGQVQGSLITLIDDTTGVLLLTTFDTDVTSGYPGVSLQAVTGTPADHIADNWSGGIFH